MPAKSKNTKLWKNICALQPANTHLEAEATKEITRQLSEHYPIWEGLCFSRDLEHILGGSSAHIRDIEKTLVGSILNTTRPPSRNPGDEQEKKFEAVFGEITGEGINPNITWVPAGLLAVMNECYLGDYKHGNTLDLAIHAGNKIALELLLLHSTITMCTQTFRDLLEKTPLNLVYTDGRCKAWALSPKHRFGLLRVAAHLLNREKEIVPKELTAHGSKLDEETKSLLEKSGLTTKTRP